MSLISGLSKFYANSMSALRLIEYHWEKQCLVAFPTIFYANAVRQGFVFIEKLQNNDLTITSFAALRRPNNDIWRFQGWPVSILACFRRKNIWLLNIQCPWMIHCTNLKRFPQYLKCPRVNHSITSDENSPRPPFKRPGLSLSYLKCLQMGGGGSRPLLENVQKETAFSSVWLPLVDQRFVINATELPRLIFLKLAYILFSEIILLFPSSVGVCVFESVNRSLEWIFTIYQYVLLRLLVRWSWSTVNPCRSFTNGFVSQGSKNLAKFYLVVYAPLSG